jgi:hypothetical protein
MMAATWNAAVCRWLVEVGSDKVVESTQRAVAIDQPAAGLRCTT